MTKTTMKTIDQIADEVHANAWEKGWHDKDETEDHFIERCCNNMHDEVCELHEAWRNGMLHELCDKSRKMELAGLEPLTCIEEEYADIIIRALDNCRKLGINIQRAIETKHRFNMTRPHRHGGKKS